ncbi:BTAD domain-containing putative transcriptional regulator [Micromonospora sp. DT228]|uniref:BTAD domain-containing putative transcriptional regulator n=1 Tax=Micromonospora sp. DT228 TaxID=3393443 RepID=UPI003CF646CC
MAAVELPRLEELRTAAVENRVEADLLLGRHREFVAELMAALCHNGRQAEVLQIFHEGRRRLADEHGMDPGAYAGPEPGVRARHGLTAPPKGTPASRDAGAPSRHH